MPSFIKIVLNLKSGKTGFVTGEKIYKDDRLKKGFRAVYVVRTSDIKGLTYWNKDACTDVNPIVPQINGSGLESLYV